MRQQDKTRARPRPRQPSQAFASRSIDPKTETFKDVFKVKRKHGTVESPPLRIAYVLECLPDQGHD